jgi:hypothetical protein
MVSWSCCVCACIGGGITAAKPLLRTMGKQTRVSQGFPRVHVIQSDAHDLVVTCIGCDFGPTHIGLPPCGTLDDAMISEHPAFILRKLQSIILNSVTASKGTRSYIFARPSSNAVRAAATASGMPSGFLPPACSIEGQNITLGVVFCYQKHCKPAEKIRMTTLYCMCVMHMNRPALSWAGRRRRRRTASPARPPACRHSARPSPRRG